MYRKLENNSEKKPVREFKENFDKVQKKSGENPKGIRWEHEGNLERI